MAAQNRRKQAAKSNSKVFYWILGGVGLIGAIAILTAVMQGRSEAAMEPLDLTEVADARSLLERAEGVPLGEENAPVKIFVFSDYMCPACKVWMTSVEQSLKADMIESGQAQLVYYDFPLVPGHRYSFIAARAARCAGDQDRFWDYHDMLFTQQESWSFEASPPLGTFKEYANTLGLDAAQFDQCLESDAHAEVVTANKLLGEQLGVRGTPTVFVNGRQLRNWNNWEGAREEIRQITGS